MPAARHTLVVLPQLRRGDAIFAFVLALILIPFSYKAGDKLVIGAALQIAGDWNWWPLGLAR